MSKHNVLTSHQNRGKIVCVPYSHMPKEYVFMQSCSPADLALASVFDPAAEFHAATVAFPAAFEFLASVFAVALSDVFVAPEPRMIRPVIAVAVSS